MAIWNDVFKTLHLTKYKIGNPLSISPMFWFLYSWSTKSQVWETLIWKTNFPSIPLCFSHLLVFWMQGCLCSWTPLVTVLACLPTGGDMSFSESLQQFQPEGPVVVSKLSNSLYLSSVLTPTTYSWVSRCPRAGQEALHVATSPPTLRTTTH